MGIFAAIIHKETLSMGSHIYVAECPDIGTVSQGETIEIALENLQEATELYLEEFPSTKRSNTFLTTFTVKSA